MEELEIVPQEQVDGIRIFINKVEYRSAHFHPEWELIWVLDSSLYISFAQKKHLIQPGELILFSPNLPHEFHEMERPCTFLCLQISTKIFPTTAHLRVDEIRLAGQLPEAETRQLRQVMLEMAQAYFSRQPHCELYCIGHSGLILHKLLQSISCHVMSSEALTQMAQRNARLIRLIQFVDENYMHKIRLADFAQQEGCSIGYMSHFVREAMNQTFQDYVTSVRFNCARRLMALTGESLVSICYESGFSDYRYFSRSFQEAYGMTPAEYRLQTQAKPSELDFHSGSLHSREEIYSNRRSLAVLGQLWESFPEASSFPAAEDRQSVTV